MRKKYGPFDLTGPNAAVLLQEEREETLREENKLRDDEDRRDWNEAQRAVDSGHTLTDLRGRRIRGRGSNPLISAIYPYNHGRTVADDFIKYATVNMAWGQFFLDLQEYYLKSALAWATARELPKPEPDIKAHFEDKELSFEEIHVSRATFEQMVKQRYEVNDLGLQIEASTDPWEENKLRDDRNAKLTLYDMCTLPGGKDYIHFQRRVEFMEKLTNPHQNMEQLFPVTVCRPKRGVQDGMRIYSKIGDAFNQDVAEVTATGDHLKVQIPARPIPPPGWHIDS